MFPGARTGEAAITWLAVAHDMSHSNRVAPITTKSDHIFPMSMLPVIKPAFAVLPIAPVLYWSSIGKR